MLLPGDTVRLSDQAVGYGGLSREMPLTIVKIDAWYNFRTKQHTPRYTLRTPEGYTWIAQIEAIRLVRFAF